MPMNASQFLGKTYRIMDLGGGAGLTAPDEYNVFLLNTDGPEQEWKLVDAGGGQFRIRSIRSGKVLDVRDASTDEHALIIQEIENGTPSQLWTLQEAGDDAYQIRSIHSGKALSLSVLRIYPPRVAQMEYRGTPDQHWHLQEA